MYSKKTHSRALLYFPLVSSPCVLLSTAQDKLTIRQYGGILVFGQPKAAPPESWKTAKNLFFFLP